MSKTPRNCGLWLAVSRTVFLAVLASLLYLLVVTDVPVLVWAAIAAAGVVLTLAVVKHARRTSYRCGSCGLVFVISAWLDFLSPHLPGSKLLRCPSCGQVTWCRAETTKSSERDAQV